MHRKLQILRFPSDLLSLKTLELFQCSFPGWKRTTGSLPAPRQIPGWKRTTGPLRDPRLLVLGQIPGVPRGFVTWGLGFPAFPSFGNGRIGLELSVVSWFMDAVGAEEWDWH